MPSNHTMPSPRDEESGSNETDSLLGRGQRKAKRFWDGFIDFAFQGNILQIAFGLILAAAFTDLTKSFVSDLLMPPISIILPLNKNIEEKFAVLQPGPNFNKSTGYNTLHQAQDDGAVVLSYGIFINQTIQFFMLGVCLYMLARFYTMVSHDPIIKHTIKCKYCRQRINEKAARCIHCTSWLDGREDRS
ncbi:large-conductance mechanosensitive channel [Thelonectria olida]|uniref:Large-conductance mechanosensitive channel n=1 Tax=Thelonectria olida TaxID=1576542 RepID=A0A9P8WCJ4_9HYPO|nr:large-conductance mechanosensitive channel [Thelonectria olida]